MCLGKCRCFLSQRRHLISYLVQFRPKTAIPTIFVFFFFYIVMMEVQSFHVVVNLEFLLVLSNVFMSALTTDESASTTPAAIQEPSQAVAKQTPVTVEPVDKEPPQITVQISVKDPEIVLLADAKDKDTNALFLKVS